MRTPEDIKTIRFEVLASIKLDMERVEEDPVWNSITANILLETEDDLKVALVKYFNHYFANEILFQEVPSTCGPADIYTVKARVFERRKKETTNDEHCNSGSPRDGVCAG